MPEPTPTSPHRRPAPLAVVGLALATAAVVAVGGLVIATGRVSRDTEVMRSHPGPSLDRAREVLVRRHIELLHRYDAIGVGVRRRSLEDPEAVLVVYLLPSAVAPNGAVRVDGVPVLFEITGRTRRSFDATSPSPPG
ncbi:MAG: hypothetical protein AAGE94_18445 [Acidobacteriota bacterium]